jgi:O-antigen/teichoic acid export membrane protein
VVGGSAGGYVAHAGEAGVWLGSRLTNGLLGLLHVTLVTAAIGPGEAGRFFFLWTSVWLLGTVLRFGIEGILPRVVAEAQVAGHDVPSLRRPALAGLAACAIALVPLLVLFRLPVSAATLGVALALAACWAGTLVLSATLKAHGRVGLSGVVGNTIWPLGPALAPLPLLGSDAGWQDVAVVTTMLAALSLAAGYAVAARSLGRAPLRRLFSRRGTALRLEADVLGAALLSVLYEVLLWLPVVMLALAGIGGVVAAGVFAAVRVTGLVSWPYNAVVALLTPRIAQGLAAKDLARTRRLLLTGSLIGLGVTVPAAIAVAVAARPILELFDPAFGFLASALALLVIGRVFDAAAGPVGEALLVGRGTWLDCALVSAGVAAGLTLGLALEPTIGAEAAGIAGSVAFAFTNLLRLGAVWRLLAHGWQIGAALPGRRRGLAVATALLAAGTVLAVGLNVFQPLTRDWVWAGAVASVLAAAGAIGAGAARHGVRATVASPVGPLALILIAHFALRPATLVLDPASAEWALRTIGFAWSDVTQAAALGAAGLGLFAVGFQGVWRPSTVPRAEPSPDVGRLVKAVAGALALGSLLWLILFARLGGPAALADDPSAVHLKQFGAGYGTLGLALCLGAALAAIQAWLARPGRVLLATAVVASLVGIAGSIGLATRGAAVATALAALALVIRARRPRRRTLIVALVCVVALAATAIALRAVRDYSLYEPTGNSAASVARTPPLRLLSPDLIEFDHLVALEGLVPERVDWLDGESLANVPAAFVPRALWPDKPRPLDFRLAEKLHGVGVTSGNPFTLPGEMWWNLRFGGAVAGLLLLGMLTGLLWRLLLERGGAAGELVTAVLTGYSYLIFTRPLGPMLLTAVTAAVAALAVHLAATVRVDRVALRARLDAVTPVLRRGDV